MGEKCTKLFKTDSNGKMLNEIIYITLCQKCTNILGTKMLEESKSIKVYNDILLSLPEKERKLKVRMIMRLEKRNNNNG